MKWAVIGPVAKRLFMVNGGDPLPSEGHKLNEVIPVMCQSIAQVSYCTDRPAHVF